MTISFHLDDLRKTAAGVSLGPADKEALEALGQLNGEAAETELRRLLGRVAVRVAVVASRLLAWSREEIGTLTTDR